jgi:hypothetical protein
MTNADNDTEAKADSHMLGSWEGWSLARGMVRERKRTEETNGIETMLS